MWSSVNKLLKLNPGLPLRTVIRLLRNQAKDLETTPSLEQRLQELNKRQSYDNFKVDIGLPPPNKLKKKDLVQRLKYLAKRRNDPELERDSRNLQMKIDYEAIREEWSKESAPQQIQMMADHLSIFDDLFGDAYFTPYVIMDVYYPQQTNNLIAPVCRGNVVKPTEAFNLPVVKFESNPEELWTLTLVNPDGHFTEENMEYVHWLVGNIPGGDVSKGETIFDYLPPFPPRGLGFQRFVFVLYKQDQKIDYSKLKKNLPCLELSERSFKTLEFYRERQDVMTPAGLSFFQSDWDKTSKKVFYELLNMEEPVFEYDHNPQPLNKQQWFPKKKPFNLYLDRYRDPRDIAQEYLEKKIKNFDPFSPPKKPFPYPKAYRQQFSNMPSWLKTKEERTVTGRGRVTSIQREEYE